MSKKINPQTISEIKLSLIKDKKILFKNFEDFNIYLVNFNIKITIIDYIKCIHLYLFKHVDINLLTDFLNYCKDDMIFSIDSEILLKYRLITNLDEITIKEFIDKYKLHIDSDYRIRKINKKSIINNNLQDYKFTPRVLKRCLLQSNIEYIDYYLLIENCILHYTNYQTNLFNKLGFIQDIKLDNLIKNYEYQNEKIEHVYNNIGMLNNQNKLLNSNINYTYKKVIDILYKLNLQEINDNINSKFIKVINTFALYNTPYKNKIFYIDCNTKIFNNVEKMTKLEYEVECELLYKKEYNVKHINVLSKLLLKFNNDIEINQFEIILLNNIKYNTLINYLNEEFAKFN